jgi:hypothetical protein
VTRIRGRTDFDLVDGLRKLNMLTDEALVMGFADVDDVGRSVDKRVQVVNDNVKAVGHHNDYLNLRDITSFV